MPPERGGDGAGGVACAAAAGEGALYFGFGSGLVRKCWERVEQRDMRGELSEREPAAKMTLCFTRRDAWRGTPRDGARGDRVAVHALVL